MPDLRRLAYNDEEFDGGVMIRRFKIWIQERKDKIRISEFKNSAALDFVFPKLGGICIASELQLFEAEVEIAKFTEWAKKLEPSDRKAYMNWLKHFSIRIKERRKEIRYQEEFNEFMKNRSFPKP